MSVFGSIMSKIFGHADPAAASPGTAASPGSSANPFAAPGAPDAAAPTPSTATSAPTTTPASQPGSAQPTPSQPVDVGAVLADMAGKSSQPLNYKTSIVDLMKLLGLDSSLENRKSLATELHYSGDTNDSASMNVWLHKQVMDKLAENGGTVPADLRA